MNIHRQERFDSFTIRVDTVEISKRLKLTFGGLERVERKGVLMILHVVFIRTLTSRPYEAGTEGVLDNSWISCMRCAFFFFYYQ